MKMKPDSKPGTSGTPTGSQKTLLHFFQRQTTSTVEKIACPACLLQVPKSKINWHLDQDCKSKSKKGKGKKSKNSALSKKEARALEEEAKSKVRRLALLSGSEDEDDKVSAQPAPRLRDILFDSSDSDDDTPYISSSMVEAVIDIDDDEPGLQFSSPNTPSKDPGKDQISPYFSPDSKNLTVSPSQRKEKVVQYEMPTLQPSSVSKLQADWSSPEPSPEKSYKKPQCRSPAVIVSTPSPQTKSGNETRVMLEDDWTSPAKTPKREGSLLCTQRNGSLVSPGSVAKSASESEEDFEEETFIPRMPNTPTPRKSPKFLTNKSPKPVNNESDAEYNSEDDFESSSLPSLNTNNNNIPPVKTVQGISTLKSINNQSPSSSSPQKGVSESAKKFPNISATAHALSPCSCSGDSITVSQHLFTSPGNSHLVTPVRCPSLPSLSPQPHGSPTHIRQLFSSQSFSESTPKPKINVTAKIQNAVSAHSSSSQDALFDSLSQRSPPTSKQSFRSPRKFHQGLKKTGLLENSSQNLSKITPRKKRTQSPSSASSSPYKSGNSQQPNPSKSIDGDSQQKVDPARYRNFKGYYLDNFLRILDTVTSEPQDVKLFNDEDLANIKTFHGLTLQAQKLYVRLFQRKIKWHKVSKLEYREICDTEDMQLYVNELVYAGFLSGEKEVTELQEVLKLLTVDELQKLCRQIKIPSSGRKDDLVKALLKHSTQQRTFKSIFSKSAAGSANTPLMNKAKEMMGAGCLVVSEMRRVFMRVLLLYGLPRYDDDEEGGQQGQLTMLLMVNMGKIQFPQYSTNRTRAIFRAREDLIKFEEVCQMQMEVQEATENQKWVVGVELCEAARTTYHTLIADQELLEHDKSLPRFLRRFTSISVLVYLVTCGVECRQRMKDYQGAVEYLQELLGQTTHLQDYRGRWYDRLALNLQAHLKKPLMAVETIAAALKDPEVRHGHRLSLSLRAERLAGSRQHKTLIPKVEAMTLMSPTEAPRVIIEGRSILNDMPGFKRMFILQDSARHAGEGEVTVCSVEELAVEHYKGQGYTQGLHREGTTVKALFGLLFWDVLYSDVPDVFRSPHQATPLDLDDAHFYSARKEMIDARLHELRESWSEEDAEVELSRVWVDHYNEVSLVNWDLFRNLDHLKGLVKSMGLKVVADMCERLARDHRFCRSGFPDLIVWNPDTKVYRIVEVKGPNDRLSTKQILWLDYLLTHGAVAEVCHVEAIGAKRMKKASPRKVSPKKTSPKKTPPKKSPPKKSPPKKSPPKKSPQKSLSVSEDEDAFFEELMEEADARIEREASVSKGKKRRARGTYIIDRSDNENAAPVKGRGRGMKKADNSSTSSTGNGRKRPRKDDGGAAVNGKDTVIKKVRKR